MLALDHDLKLTNECLSSYVEFKRQSVQLIFDQFAGDMDNDLIGGIGGDHDENLETQSSLDNNTNQHTGEERSRFSKSIISSTQKSDTASLTNPTRSQQKSQKQRQESNVERGAEHERGQSMPKQGILKQKVQTNVENQQDGQGDLLDEHDSTHQETLENRHDMELRNDAKNSDGVI